MIIIVKGIGDQRLTRTILFQEVPLSRRVVVLCVCDRLRLLDDVKLSSVRLDRLIPPFLLGVGLTGGDVGVDVCDGVVLMDKDRCCCCELVDAGADTGVGKESLKEARDDGGGIQESTALRAQRRRRVEIQPLCSAPNTDQKGVPYIHPSSSP